MLPYKDTKLKKRRRRAARADVNNYAEPAAKALVVGELIAIFHPGDRKS